jgi:hypothetical protein
MAIIWDDAGQSHMIRRGGIEIDKVTPADIDPADPRNDRAIEAAIKSRIQGKAAAANRGCVVLVHVFSRDPLDYALGIAPPGAIRPFENWWETPGGDPANSRRAAIFHG